jgi:hypothetical protein
VPEEKSAADSKATDKQTDSIPECVRRGYVSKLDVFIERTKNERRTGPLWR